MERVATPDQCPWANSATVGCFVGQSLTRPPSGTSLRVFEREPQARTKTEAPMQTATVTPEIIVKSLFEQMDASCAQLRKSMDGICPLSERAISISMSGFIQSNRRLLQMRWRVTITPAPRMNQVAIACMTNRRRAWLGRGQVKRWVPV